MALSLGGKASGTSASGTTCVSAAFDVAPAVGGKILFGVGWFDDTSRTASAVDNASGGSNSYAACGAKVAGGGSTEAIQLFEATVARTTASFVITVTFSGEAGTSRISCIWIDGSPGSSELYHGQLQSTGVTTTDGTTTGSLGTPSAAGAFVFAFSRSSSQPDNFAAGTGFTTVHNLNVAQRTYSEYLVQGAATAVAGTFTQDYTNSIQSVAVVVVPAGGGGGRTVFGRSGLDGYSIEGIKQFNPTLS